MKDQEKELPAQGDPKSAPLPGGLYVVGTPIGNREDLGFRALRVLRSANWVAAEDTRETRKLLEHYGVSQELRALHEHSTNARIEELVQSLKDGAAGAYVSDAGTPGVCDPGPDLVAACARAGIPVYAVPGPSALAAILSVAGFPESAFTFHGFFPRERKDRDAFAARARAAGGVQVFYEAPHRVREGLAFLADAFPDAPLVVGRELTKRFETLYRATVREVAERLAKEEPRGEYALALLLPPAAEAPRGLAEEELRELVKELALLGASQKALVRVAMSHGMRKNEAYRLGLEFLEKGSGNP
jgi:16S rRNA (cytidine1402-2'-O)-methyltransferase